MAQDKATQIIAKIVDMVNEGKIIDFSADWGGNSLTVSISGLGHTHVGGTGDGDLSELIDQLHDLLIESRGLTFAGDSGPFTTMKGRVLTRADIEQRANEERSTRVPWKRGDRVRIDGRLATVDQVEDEGELPIALIIDDEARQAREDGMLPPRVWPLPEELHLVTPAPDAEPFRMDP